MIAAQLARQLHEGQLYGSRDYFEAHLSVVACNTYNAAVGLESSSRQFDGGFKWVVEAVGYLHDSIEDCGVDACWLYEELHEHYTNADIIVSAVEALTKKKGEDYNTYIQRVKQNEYAAFVKYFDSEANMYACIADGDEKRAQKYLKNMCELSGFVKGE